MRKLFFVIVVLLSIFCANGQNIQKPSVRLVFDSSVKDIKLQGRFDVLDDIRTVPLPDSVVDKLNKIIYDPDSVHSINSNFRYVGGADISERVRAHLIFNELINDPIYNADQTADKALYLIITKDDIAISYTDLSIDYRHRTLYAAVDYHQYALINDGTIEIYAYGKRDERGAAPFGSPGGSSNVNLDECKLTNVFDILPDGTIKESDKIVDDEDIDEPWKVTKEDNRQMLRDYFLFCCIEQGIKTGKINLKDISRGVAFELSNYPPEVFNTVDSLAKETVNLLQPSIIVDHGGNYAALWDLLQVYNSEAAKEYIESLDQYICDD